MTFSIPELSLVLLIGPSGSGKSTFAKRHFLSTEIISSDRCRGLISDDENNQTVTPEAFTILHAIAAQRFAFGRLTVIDATNVLPESRSSLVALARRYHVLPVAIVLNLSEEVCHQRNQSRPDRSFGPHVVRNQRAQLRRSIRRLKSEGFRHVVILENESEVETITIERKPMWCNRKEEHGPFDIIGDVHGCASELEHLLVKLGYQSVHVDQPEPGWSSTGFVHPDGRKAVFVGDLVDRGPRVLDTLRIVRQMVSQGSALCVPGNHDVKLLKKLNGRDVSVSHGLAETLAEIEALSPEIRPAFEKSLANFLDGLISHYVLDRGKLVVAHAGLKAEMHGRGSGRVRDFALYGETTGEIDEFGLPVRLNWAANYRGPAMVVYGHTPVPEPEWLNHTTNVDTGCVFGGRLTALRYPEREFVSVPAERIYCTPSRPFLTPLPTTDRSAQQENDDLLDLADVRGKRQITTQLRGTVIIREEQSTAALEVMSRFAVNPKWLVYLPPTMSPCETSSQPGLLEHPAEAFAYYRNQGLDRVICEEKHMGSRAVILICRDEAVARERFGIVENEFGIIITRTGRRFFNDRIREPELLGRIRSALDTCEFWSTHETNWACFDCEIMPWSAKAQELLKQQYAAVGSAGRAALPHAVEALSRAKARLVGDEQLQTEQVLQETQTRFTNIQLFIDSYQRYCWPVNSIDDLKIAPFHLMATEGRVHSDQTHLWHMESVAPLVNADRLIFRSTATQIVDLCDPDSENAGIDWWTKLTQSGGEGMVVKPIEFLARGKKGLIQPAVKCRGAEYLRIIYGPDYSIDANRDQLRKRNVSRKQALALNEFALGLEGLDRFVRREPLRRVHECVFGVLACESEPVDPRL